MLLPSPPPHFGGGLLVLVLRPAGIVVDDLEAYGGRVLLVHVYAVDSPGPPVGRGILVELLEPCVYPVAQLLLGGDADPPEHLAGEQEYILFPNYRFNYMELSVTCRCNMNCKHCFNAPDAHPRIVEPTFEQLVDALDQMQRRGMVVNEDGFIVAHNDESFNGQYLQDFYGKELLNEIVKTKEGIIRYEMDDDSCTLFVCPIMEQWYAVVVVDNSELFTDVHSQLAVNIMIFLVAFLLISFFYYLGYKNERDFSRKVEAMNIQVVSALAAAIDAKDPYTNGHSSRVAKYSRMIAKRAGYSESRQDEIYMMGLLHDVGKIGVPDEVLNYPGKLSAEDFEKIKKHPMIGYNILQSIKERSGLSIGARWHHERYAGGGYPDGIAGEEIPEEARIIAVADAYDAMSSKRNYRDLMPQAKVREEIEKGSGTQFDPRFAKIMLQMMDEDPEYTMIGKESGNSYGEK